MDGAGEYLEWMSSLISPNIPSLIELVETRSRLYFCWVVPTPTPRVRVRTALELRSTIVVSLVEKDK